MSKKTLVGIGVIIFIVLLFLMNHLTSGNIDTRSYGSEFPTIVTDAYSEEIRMTQNMMQRHQEVQRLSNYQQQQNFNSKNNNAANSVTIKNYDASTQDPFEVKETDDPGIYNYNGNNYEDGERIKKEFNSNSNEIERMLQQQSKFNSNVNSQGVQAEWFESAVNSPRQVVNAKINSAGQAVNAKTDSPRQAVNGKVISVYLPDQSLMNVIATVNDMDGERHTEPDPIPVESEETTPRGRSSNDQQEHSNDKTDGYDDQENSNDDREHEAKSIINSDDKEKQIDQMHVGDDDSPDDLKRESYLKRLSHCNIPPLSSWDEFYSYISTTSRCQTMRMFGGYLMSDDKFVGHKVVCMDPGTGPRRNNCTVLSFGNNGDWSFDDAMGQYGCRVYSFDPMIGKPQHQRSPNVMFYPVGLGDKNIRVPVGLRSAPAAVPVEYLTYRNIIEQLGLLDTPIDFLKIDAEGDELKFFKNVFTESPELLRNVRQISVEIHPLKSFELRGQLWDALHKLRCLSFRKVFSEPNSLSTFEYKGSQKSSSYGMLWVNILATNNA